MSVPFGFFIDIEESAFEKGLAFWSAALDVEPVHGDDPTSPYYRFPVDMSRMYLEVQRVGAPSRYHFDLVAADVEGEASRLEGLGARRVEKIESWWVMEAPTGHIFCVVPEE